MLRPGRLACPTPTGTFTSELPPPLSPSESSNITTRVNSQIPRLDLHQQDRQPYGLRTEWREGAPRAGRSASVVSALSSFVAKSRQTNSHVSSSPSKIPYGGFSPVRLQTGLRPLRPSTAGHALKRTDPHTRAPASLIRSRPPSMAPLWPLRARWRDPFSGRSSPEALGSPAGSIVPPGPRLLWPHLRLSAPPATLCIMRRASPDGLLWAGTERVPNLICLSLPPCRLPYPDGPERCV